MGVLEKFMIDSVQYSSSNSGVSGWVDADIDDKETQEDLEFVLSLFRETNFNLGPQAPLVTPGWDIAWESVHLLYV